MPCGINREQSDRFTEFVIRFVVPGERNLCSETLGLLTRGSSPPEGRRENGYSTSVSNTRTFFQLALFSSMN